MLSISQHSWCHITLFNVRVSALFWHPHTLDVHYLLLYHSCYRVRYTCTLCSVILGILFSFSSLNCVNFLQTHPCILGLQGCLFLQLICTYKATQQHEECIKWHTWGEWHALPPNSSLYPLVSEWRHLRCAVQVQLPRRLHWHSLPDPWVTQCDGECLVCLGAVICWPHCILRHPCSVANNSVVIAGDATHDTSH